MININTQYISEHGGTTTDIDIYCLLFIIIIWFGCLVYIFNTNRFLIIYFYCSVNSYTSMKFWIYSFYRLYLVYKTTFLPIYCWWSHGKNPDTMGDAPSCTTNDTKIYAPLAQFIKRLWNPVYLGMLFYCQFNLIFCDCIVSTGSDTCACHLTFLAPPYYPLLQLMLGVLSSNILRISYSVWYRGRLHKKPLNHDFVWNFWICLSLQRYYVSGLKNSFYIYLII